jgi:hypothetical protein
MQSKSLGFLVQQEYYLKVIVPLIYNKFNNYIYSQY